MCVHICAMCICMGVYTYIHMWMYVNIYMCVCTVRITYTYSTKFILAFILLSPEYFNFFLKARNMPDMIYNICLLHHRYMSSIFIAAGSYPYEKHIYPLECSITIQILWSLILYYPLETLVSKSDLGQILLFSST